MRKYVCSIIILAGMSGLLMNVNAAPSPPPPMDPELSAPVTPIVERQTALFGRDGDRNEDGRGGDRDGDGNGRRHCSQTAEALLRACKAEIQADYWTAFAACLNIADSGDREECMTEAKDALREAERECRDQFEARNDVCRELGQARYSPEIDPDNFLSPEAAAQNPNPYFPLVPGTTWHYEGEDETIDVTVKGETIEIMGVECFIVNDVVRENGAITENTQDYFAVDEDGTVWYFGEHSETIEDGVVTSLEGSWLAGEDGAQPGIIMLADPEVGDVYRQEWAPGTAEDMGEVISVTGDESVTAANCNGQCVVVRDFTPLEPGANEHKFYAINVGFMLEIDPETKDRLELTSFTAGAHLARPASAAPAQARSGALLSPLKVESRFGVTSFGSGSTIRFDLERPTDLNVDVYDSQGRRVQALFAGKREAGSQTFEWQGKDAGGHQVPNGIYFVRVRAGAESQTSRVAILAR
jgi:hypothetical protein